MINNKRGEGYVSISVLIIVICMILSVFVMFASAVNVVNVVKSNTKTVLENHVTYVAINIFNSIKRGTNKTDKLDSVTFSKNLADFCTFETSGEFMYHKDENGESDYYISTPQLGFAERGKLRLYAGFTLYVPIHFDRIKIGTASIPIRVEVNLDKRY